MDDFSAFSLDPSILRALQELGFDKPSPIQQEAIPHILGGRDVMGLAETGSGKTAACAIPVCQRVDPSRPEVQALIVVPTRELALQYAVETQKIGKHKGVKAYALYGGEDQSLQEAKLRAGVQVLVATPGRLIDLIYQRLLDLSHVDIFALDEADEMLSMGFFDDLEMISQCLVHRHDTLLFSATMSDPVRKLAERYMRDPIEVRLTSKKATPEKIEHRFVYCRSLHDKEEQLWRILDSMQPKQSIIFCRSRHETEKVAAYLQRHMRGVDYLHGGLNQDVRTIITNKFRTGRVHHMVATDVASRGLDFAGLTHVFMVHIPDDSDLYIHRCGRTGRSGREGVAVSFVTDREMSSLRAVLKRLPADRVSWIGDEPKSLTDLGKGKESKAGGRGRPRRSVGRYKKPKEPRTPDEKGR